MKLSSRIKPISYLKAHAAEIVQRYAGHPGNRARAKLGKIPSALRLNRDPLPHWRTSGYSWISKERALIVPTRHAPTRMDDIHGRARGEGYGHNHGRAGNRRLFR